MMYITKIYLFFVPNGGKQKPPPITVRRPSMEGTDVSSHAKVERNKYWPELIYKRVIWKNSSRTYRI